MIKNISLFASILIALSGCATKTTRPELQPSKQKSTTSSLSHQSGKGVGSSKNRSAPLRAEPVAVSTTPQAPGLISSKPTAADVALSESAQQMEREARWLDALFTYQQLSETAPSPQDQTLYRLKTQAIIDSRLTEADLKMVSTSTKANPSLRAHALLRLGILSYNQKKFDDAEEALEDSQKLSPNSEVSFQAQTYLNNLKSTRTTSSQTIGVVLPMSGRSARIGQSTLRGIELGLGIGQPGNNFKLVVVDSEGDVEKARQGAEKLIKEDGVIAIIGDILSKTSPAVASVGQEFGVPVINLSQRADITQLGEYVFRNALTARAQVHFLARTAVQDLGMKRFAIMYPNSSYGVEYANLFWDYVSAYGGKITAVQGYEPSEKDFRHPVQRLVSTYYGEARQEEYQIRMQELKAQDKKRSIRSSNAEVVLQPITDFDAVFVADGLQQLGIISSMLAYYDVPSMYFLGTNIWNNSGVAKRTSIFGDNVVFTDSYQSRFNGTDRYRFVMEFKSAYKEEPGLFEIQGYDSALLVRHFITEGATSRGRLRDRLNEFEKLPGAIGYMKSSADREIQRPITAFTLKNGEIVPLKVIK